MNIEPSTVAFDIDGVVADTMRLFLEIAESEYGIAALSYDDIVDYDLRNCLDISEELMMTIIVKIMAGDFSGPLHPIEGAPQALKKINHRHRPTLFVTARPDKAHITKWLCEHLDTGDGAIEVVATGSFEGKSEILEMRNIRYFVEDRLETCFLLAKAGIEPIVFAQPWNRKPHPFAEVGTWKEIESLLRIS